MSPRNSKIEKRVEEEEAAALQYYEAYAASTSAAETIPSLDLKTAFQAYREVPKWYSSVTISVTDKLADQIMAKLERYRPEVLYINAERAEANITALCKEEEKDLKMDYASEVCKELSKSEMMSSEFSEQVMMLAKVVIYEIDLKDVRDLVKIG